MYRIFLVLTLLVNTQVKAQMEAAEKVHWDADTVVNFTVKSSPVWDLIKDMSKWNELSNGFVQSVTVSGQEPNQTRIVKFADGSERKDLITQYQPEYKMIVLKLADPLPAGIQDATVAYYVSHKESGGSELRVTILVKGEKAGKNKLVERLKQEAASYLKGISAKLSGQ